MVNPSSEEDVEPEVVNIVEKKPDSPIEIPTAESDRDQTAVESRSAGSELKRPQLSIDELVQMVLTGEQMKSRIDAMDILINKLGSEENPSVGEITPFLKLIGESSLTMRILRLLKMLQPLPLSAKQALSPLIPKLGDDRPKVRQLTLKLINMWIAHYPN